MVRDDRGEPLVDAAFLATRIGIDVGWVNDATIRYGLPHYRFGGQVRFAVGEGLRWARTWSRDGASTVPGAARDDGR